MDSIRLLLILLIFSTAACDSAESVVEEDTTATRAVLTLEDAESPEPVSWSAENAVGLTGGATLENDTLALSAGATFSGAFEFFGPGGKNLNQRIRGEAERYQIFYEVSGLESMRVKVEDTETDYGGNQFGINLPVGLRISITTPVTQTPQTGTLRVRIGYFANGQKNGFTLTVDPINDFIIPVRIVPVVPPPEPPPPSVVTMFRLDLARQDDLKSISVTAEDSIEGLDLNGGEALPGQLDIEVCERDSVDVEFECSDASELTVFQNEHYTGRVTVVDRVSGEDFTEHVRSNQEEYRIFYELQFSPTGLTYDQDANGLPVGLEIDWKLPTGIQIGGGRLIIRMHEYNPDAGGDKVNNTPSATIVHFRTRFNLDR